MLVFYKCVYIYCNTNIKIISLSFSAFFITVQVFFTIGFTALLVSCILILAVHLCMSPEKDALVVRIIAALTLMAGEYFS